MVTTEFNIEGYPSADFLKLIREVHPEQATLVPDPPDVLTSNAGWDTVCHAAQLKELIAEIKSYGIRTSIFIAPDPAMIEAAAAVGTERIELYIGGLCFQLLTRRAAAIAPYAAAAAKAEVGLGINADMIQSGKPAIFHSRHSRTGRGFHRACADQRRAPFWIGEYSSTLFACLARQRGPCMKFFFNRIGEGRPLIILHGLFGLGITGRPSRVNWLPMVLPVTWSTSAIMAAVRTVRISVIR